MQSERIEEYLEAIYKRQKSSTTVSTSTLAKDLDVSLPAVTVMVQKLEKKGLVEYRSNRGVSLTPEGVKLAAVTVRRHRLWERFLTDILGLKWDRVHQEACRLEHATSVETEERLAALLPDTETCPHGHSIPDREGNIREEQGTPLSEFRAGQRACILAVDREEPRLLKDIEKLGLKPRTTVFIRSVGEDGALELEADGRSVPLKKGLAAALLARPISEEEASAVEEVPVTKLSRGQTGIIKSFSGGRAMLGRCLSLGFTPGSLVKMVENFGSGPVLVRLHDTEVALGRTLAEKVIVARNKR